MKRQLELKAELARRAWRYRDLAKELRARGLDMEAEDILAVVNGKRVPDEVFKKTTAEILGRLTWEVFR